jgi:hypothetical protein
LVTCARYPAFSRGVASFTRWRHRQRGGARRLDVGRVQRGEQRRERILAADAPEHFLERAPFDHIGRRRESLADRTDRLVTERDGGVDRRAPHRILARREAGHQLRDHAPRALARREPRQRLQRVTLHRRDAARRGARQRVDHRRVVCADLAQHDRRGDLALVRRTREQRPNFLDR